MKNISLLIFFIFISLSFYFLYHSPNPSQNNNESEAPLLQESLPNITTHELTLKDSNKVYKVAWFMAENTDQVSLHSNLNDKLTSSDAKSNNSCSRLINAGFYTKEGKHVGLFTSEGIKLSDSKDSLIFSGYFWIDEEKKSHINNTPPATARVAIQSGPILMLDDKAQVISAGNDEPARRMIVATTQNKDVIFLVVYYSEFVFSGPTLTELPELIETINSNKNLQIANAVNLDGGSASVFLTDFLTLSELTKIGGYFCIK